MFAGEAQEQHEDSRCDPEPKQPGARADKGRRVGRWRGIAPPKRDQPDEQEAHGRACARQSRRQHPLGEARDECKAARDLKVPLAVLHGEAEQLVNGLYLGSVAMPTLWRGAVQTILEAGHAPQ
jgi:hypothetical protein